MTRIQEKCLLVPEKKEDDPHKMEATRSQIRVFGQLNDRVDWGKFNFEAIELQTIWVGRKFDVFISVSDLFQILQLDQNWWTCGPICGPEIESGCHILQQWRCEQSELRESCELFSRSRICFKFFNWTRIDGLVVQYVVQNENLDATLVQYHCKRILQQWCCGQC